MLYPYLRDLIDEAKNYLLLPQERGQMQGPRTRPRRPVNPYEVLYAVGGWCSGDAIQTVERYDPIREEWNLVAPMNKRRCGVGVAVVGMFIFFSIYEQPRLSLQVDSKPKQKIILQKLQKM